MINIPNDEKQDIVDMILQCYDRKSLYSLEPELNTIGLTIQKTNNNQYVLCRIKDGRPTLGKPIYDHIYIGNTNNELSPIPNKLIKTILRFINKHRGEPAAITNEHNSFSGHTQLYGKIFAHSNHLTDKQPNKEEPVPKIPKSTMIIMDALHRLDNI